MNWKRSALVIACTVAATSAITAASLGSSKSGEVVVGASLPLTGALAPFGDLYLPGYKQAVAEANASGGILVAGKKVKVKLVVLDNKSDGTLAARQIRTLVESNGAKVLLGAVGPELNIPQAATAESLRVPYVTTSMPILPWRATGGTKRRYSWAFFFDPSVAIQYELKGALLAKTNKKIAFFADNDGDGKAWNQLLSAAAPKLGFKIVHKATVPTGTTDFRSDVQEAKAAGAQVVMAIMQAPDGIALWKQMKALGLHPKYAVCDKCGSNGAWPVAMGPTGEGTSTVAFWTAAQHHPALAHVESVFRKNAKSDIDLGLVVAGYTDGLVALDAIKNAGSTDPAAINAAIGKIDKDYPFAHIKFDNTHSSPTPSLVEQWQGGKPILIYPRGQGSGAIKTPVQGLH
jgi:branched-chain amino acid transport system substrate-binding protein